MDDKIQIFEDKRIRTALKGTVSGVSGDKVNMWYLCNSCENMVVFDCFQGEVIVSSLHAAFVSCTKLRYIMTVFNVANVVQSDLAAFGFCSALVNVKLKALMSSLDLKWSPNINKDSVLYIINNASPTSAITITLHPNAYARLADDADVVAALEAQPLVSLVST